MHVVLGGALFTPPDSAWILPGTTRTVVEELARASGSNGIAPPVTEAQLRAADEIWLAAATREVSSVTLLDGHPVGTGLPGPRLGASGRRSMR